MKGEMKNLPDNEIELLCNNHQLLFGILVSTTSVLVSHALWPFLETPMLFRLMLPFCQKNVRKLDVKKGVKITLQIPPIVS